MKVDKKLKYYVRSSGIDPHSPAFDSVRAEMQECRAAGRKRSGLRIAIAAVCAIVLSLSIALPVALFGGNNQTPDLYTFGYVASAEPYVTEDGLTVIKDVENMIDVYDAYEAVIVGCAIYPKYNGDAEESSIEFEICDYHNALPLIVPSKDDISSDTVFIPKGRFGAVKLNEYIVWLALPLADDGILLEKDAIGEEDYIDFLDSNKQHAYITKDYINFVVKENGHIIGYALCEIRPVFNYENSKFDYDYQVIEAAKSFAAPFFGLLAIMFSQGKFHR